LTDATLTNAKAGGASAAVAAVTAVPLVAPRGSFRTTVVVWAILFGGISFFAWAASHAAHRVAERPVGSAESTQR
jgi:hypothetical protein